MSIALQRAQVLVTIQAVSGVGVVHDYERYSNDAGVEEEWFTRTGKLNVWWVQSNALAPDVYTTSEQQRNTEFTLVGYLEVDDSRASKKTAEELMQTLVDAILAARTLSGTATHTNPPVPDRIQNVLVQIGEKKVLSHRVVIRWITEERADVTYA